MNTRELKLSLIQKIIQIEDVDSLQKIQVFLNNSGSLQNENLKNTSSLRNNKDDEFNETEDFTDYIKEWVKNM